jgi:hypothetical protein
LLCRGLRGAQIRDDDAQHRQGMIAKGGIIQELRRRTA